MTNYDRQMANHGLRCPTPGRKPPRILAERIRNATQTRLLGPKREYGTSRASIVKTIASAAWRIAVVAMFIIQLSSFTLFIHEEALQQLALAANTAIRAGDETIAHAIVKRYEGTMHRSAKAYRALRWTTPGASGFGEYFEVAAPAQLGAMYVQGVDAGLWKEDPRRYQQVKNAAGKYDVVDAWAADPIKSLQLRGYNPARLTPEQRAKYAGFEGVCEMDGLGEPTKHPADPTAVTRKSEQAP
jgi:hypothetical protein